MADFSVKVNGFVIGLTVPDDASSADLDYVHTIVDAVEYTQKWKRPYLFALLMWGMCMAVLMAVTVVLGVSLSSVAKTIAIISVIQLLTAGVKYFFVDRSRRRLVRALISVAFYQKLNPSLGYVSNFISRVMEIDDPAFRRKWVIESESFWSPSVSAESQPTP